MNRELLEKPFTPEQIKRRQCTNGDVLDYIEGCAVIQPLNESFDAEWNVRVLEARTWLVGSDQEFETASSVLATPSDSCLISLKRRERLFIWTRLKGRQPLL